MAIWRCHRVDTLGWEEVPRTLARFHGDHHASEERALWRVVVGQAKLVSSLEFLYMSLSNA